MGSMHQLAITDAFVPAHIEPELAEELKGFFDTVSFDAINALVAAYKDERVKIDVLADIMAKPESSAVLYHFIEGNKPDERYTMDRHIDGLFSTGGAYAHLNAVYWEKALKETDVMDYMPQQRRSEWYEQIRNPRGILKRGSKSEYELLPLPEFEEDTVRATLSGLMNSRAKFFAERVDGIFKSLSRTHVTNQPEGFSKRMILKHLIGRWGSVEWSTCGVIDDLRCIIARFMGRDEPGFGSTDTAVEIIRRQNGVWHELDGGALRMRVYNGVGTAHLEVHESIAWKLNAVLAMLYPAAIPEKNRTRRPKAKAKTAKSHELMDKLLPQQVVTVLAQMKVVSEPFKIGYQTHYRDIPNTLTYGHSRPDCKHLKAQVEEVLLAIGGVPEKHYWQFSYNPTEVVGEIVCFGAIPDHRSHQFYPTPSALAARAAYLAAQDAQDGALWLEPSAGCGALASFIPETARLHCVEISPLHVKVLQAKGFENVTQADFLEYADTTATRYDRVLLNPPFSQGRWQAHIEAAAGLLAPAGRMVAILPASAKGKTLVEGFDHVYSEILENQFAGASVSVVIATLSREDEA